MTHEAGKLRGEFKVMDLADLSQPAEGRVVYMSRWWAVADGGALFYRPPGSRFWSPQCNHDKRLVEKLMTMYPGSGVRFVPVAFIPGEGQG